MVSGLRPRVKVWTHVGSEEEVTMVRLISCTEPLSKTTTSVPSA